MKTRRLHANKLTQSQLKELFFFHEDTGVFSRKITVGGQLAGCISGSQNSDGYLQICIDSVLYKSHRLAWLYVYGVWPIGCIDHINGIRNDNRISNLRDVSVAINMQNQISANSSSSSGLRGVSKHKHGYQARIQANGVPTYLGYFKDMHEAHVAYLSAKKSLHTSFPDLRGLK